MGSRSRRRARLRVVTYNILLGGARREEAITAVLERLDADVIALQEVVDLDVVRRLAAHLGMRLLLGPPSDPASFHLALLTRLPVASWANRRHPGRMLRSHLHCAVETGAASMPVVRVHCVHLAARFGERAKGEARRMRELTAIMSDLHRERAAPHVLAGDFNALSPGDSLAATAFFRRYSELRRAGLVREAGGYLTPVRTDDDSTQARWLAAGVDPRLDVGVPVLPRAVGRLTGPVPVNATVDRFLGRFIERWTAERIVRLGYVDCYRTLHPRARGYTCATWLPAARVDYIFATADLAACVSASDVVGGRTWPDREAHVASDHYPVVADFEL